MSQFRSTRAFGRVSSPVAGMSGGGGTPPPPQENPWYATSPGVYVWGVPPGVTEVYIEQWGGGGAGAKQAGASTGGQGGGGGACATYRLGGPLIVPGGILTVSVGAGGFGDGGAGGATFVTSSANPTPRVTSGGGLSGGALGKGGTNVVVAGTGLQTQTLLGGITGGTTTNTSGGDGGKGSAYDGSGNGGAGGSPGNSGLPGFAPGGGGGGAGQGKNTFAAGAPGKVVIQY